MNLLTHTFQFRGTMSRHSFWKGCLTLVVLSVLIGFGGYYIYTSAFHLFSVYLLGVLAVALWFIIAFVSAGCRRLRDVGLTTTGIVALWILSLLTALTFTTVILLLALLPKDALTIRKGKRSLLRAE